MSHWNIVGAQAERYGELRRRSDEARMLDEARGVGRSPLVRLGGWPGRRGLGAGSENQQGFHILARPHKELRA